MPATSLPLPRSSAPRIPRIHPEGEPAFSPQVEMLIIFVTTAGAIVWVWGAWTLARWVWGLALS